MKRTIMTISETDGMLFMKIEECDFFRLYGFLKIQMKMMEDNMAVDMISLQKRDDNED